MNAGASLLLLLGTLTAGAVAVTLLMPREAPAPGAAPSGGTPTPTAPGTSQLTPVPAPAIAAGGFILAGQDVPLPPLKEVRPEPALPEPPSIMPVDPIREALLLGAGPLIGAPKTYWPDVISPWRPDLTAF